MYPGDDFLLTAFYDLSSCRQLGDGVPGPVPWHIIVQYADRAGLDPENAEALIRIIREMDSGYLKWYERKLAAKTSKMAGQSNDRLQRPRRRRSA